MGIVDFNCHILPGFDEIEEDDLKTVEAMLKAAEKQNITAMVVTPYFDMDEMTVTDFIKKRLLAIEKIQEMAEQYNVKLIPGALVRVKKGLSLLPSLGMLRIRRTNLILLDMPDEAWTEDDLLETDLLKKMGFRPVIADFDLCLDEQPNNEMVVELLKKQHFIQVSTDALLHFGTKKNTIELFTTGNAHILGSSCTNAREVKELGDARKALQKRVGEEGLSELDRFVNELLKLN